MEASRVRVARPERGLGTTRWNGTRQVSARPPQFWHGYIRKATNNCQKRPSLRKPLLLTKPFTFHYKNLSSSRIFAHLPFKQVVLTWNWDACPDPNPSLITNFSISFYWILLHYWKGVYRCKNWVTLVFVIRTPWLGPAPRHEPVVVEIVVRGVGAVLIISYLATFISAKAQLQAKSQAMLKC